MIAFEVTVTFPLFVLLANIPSPALLVRVPDALIEMSPAPGFSALIADAAPVTALAVIVIEEPAATAFLARIPCLPSPVPATLSLALTAIAPAPAFFA